MTNFRRLTPAEFEEARAQVEKICAGVTAYCGPDKHEEIGRRLYATLGEVDPDDWPTLFGTGGIKGASYLGTAYSGAKLERARRTKDACKAAPHVAQVECGEQRLRESAGGAEGGAERAVWKAR